jgi:hypothetical protein
MLHSAPAAPLPLPRNRLDLRRRGRPQGTEQVVRERPSRFFRRNPAPPDLVRDVVAMNHLQPCRRAADLVNRPVLGHLHVIVRLEMRRIIGHKGNAATPRLNPLRERRGRLHVEIDQPVKVPNVLRGYRGEAIALAPPANRRAHCWEFALGVKAVEKAGGRPGGGGRGVGLAQRMLRRGRRS